METDRFYLEFALEEAERAGQEGTYPEPIMAERVDELMQQWIADPKPQKARWTKMRA